MLPTFISVHVCTPRLAEALCQRREDMKTKNTTREKNICLPKLSLDVRQKATEDGRALCLTQVCGSGGTLFVR